MTNFYINYDCQLLYCQNEFYPIFFQQILRGRTCNFIQEKGPVNFTKDALSFVQISFADCAVYETKRIQFSSERQFAYNGLHNEETYKNSCNPQKLLVGSCTALSLWVCQTYISLRSRQYRNQTTANIRF